MDGIPNRVKHQDKRKFLELVVKNHFLELENNEYQFNLKLQEKMNKILKKELTRLKDILRKNNITIDDESSDEAEEEQHPPVAVPPSKRSATRKERDPAPRKRKMRSPHPLRKVTRPSTDI